MSSIDHLSAIESSWTREYAGNIADSVWGYARDNNIGHVKYAFILQSSGTGKSRVMDELAKSHFLLPICLREDHAAGANIFCSSLSSSISDMYLFKGFPPPDSTVRNYLIRGAACYGSRDGYMRAVSFITALFERAAEEVKKMSGALAGNISLASTRTN